MCDADAQREAAIRASLAELLARRPSLTAAVPATAAAADPDDGGLLLVVANRLPVTVSRDAAGEYAFKMSSGGLVSALVSVRTTLPFIWVGWLGTEIPLADRSALKTRLLKEHRCWPVWLSDELAESYYNGFSNGVIWPLLHYEVDASGARAFDWAQWDAYKQANALFAKATLTLVPRAARTGARASRTLVWVQDYHLMLLPALLRRRLPAATIGWFLHTPFPASEVFRTLPVRATLLRSLLTADALGFHVYDYARHFLVTCARQLPDVAVSPSSVTCGGRTTAVGVHPIGIEPQQFVAVARGDACRARLAALAAQFKGRTVVVAVDRLDPIKGVPHRLLGFEALLRRHPEHVGRVVLIQVAVPSRADVPAYAELTATVNTLVGRINGAFGSLVYQPLVYLYSSVSPVELIALYQLGDVALITSLRDGMNLVASEYVAVQAEREATMPGGPGVLVLSEFAGCAQSLAGCVRCNPWAPEDVADALHTALTLSREQRAARWAELHAHVTTFTSGAWARGIVAGLRGLAGAKEEEGARRAAGAPAGAAPLLQPPPPPAPLPLAALRSRYSAVGAAAAAGARRLLVFRYEGGLVPCGGVATELAGGEDAVDEEAPANAAPSSSAVALRAAAPPLGAGDRLAPPRHLLHALRELVTEHANDVVLVSRRTRCELDVWFGGVPRLWVVAEEGALLRAPAPVAAPPRRPGDEHGSGAEEHAWWTVTGATASHEAAARRHALLHAEPAPAAAGAPASPAAASSGDSAPTTMTARPSVFELFGLDRAPSNTTPSSQAGGGSRPQPGEPTAPHDPAREPHVAHAHGGSVGATVTASSPGGDEPQPPPPPYQWVTVAPGLAGAPLRVPAHLRAGHPPPAAAATAAAAAGWQGAVLPLLARAAQRMPPGTAVVTQGDNSATLSLLQSGACPAAHMDADMGSQVIQELLGQLEAALASVPLVITSGAGGVHVQAQGASLLAALLLVADQAWRPGSHALGGEGGVERSACYGFVLALEAPPPPSTTVTTTAAAADSASGASTLLDAVAALGAVVDHESGAGALLIMPGSRDGAVGAAAELGPASAVSPSEGCFLTWVGVGASSTAGGASCSVATPRDARATLLQLGLLAAAEQP